jgi:iron complex outermembrane receptor protein
MSKSITILLKLVMMVVFVTISLIGSSQTYRTAVIVVDEDTDQPIAGAAIGSTSGVIHGYTDAKGSLVFSSQVDTLIVIAMGYERFRIPVQPYLVNGENKHLSKNTIRLASSLTELDRVFITSQSKGIKARDAMVSTQRIEPELFENTGGFDLSETVRYIPGVSVMDDQVVIRGGSGWSYGAGSRVLLLQDGLPLYSGDAGQGQLSMVNTESLERVEVVKGPSSVLYGSSALNGVINFISKEPSDNPETGVMLTSGLYTPPPRSTLSHPNAPQTIQGLRAYHLRKLGDFDITASGQYFNDQGYRVGDYEERFIGQLGTKYHINKKWTVGVTGRFYHANTGSFLLWQSYDSAYRPLNNSSTDNRSTKWNIDPGIWYTGKHWEHTVRVRNLGLNNRVDDGNDTTDQSNSSNSIFAFHTSVRKMKKGSWLIGSYASFIKTTSPLFTGVQRASSAAIFSQINYEYRRWKFAVGSRLEQYTLNEREEIQPILRAGVNYRVNKWGSIRASYGQGYRFPTIAESFISTTVGPVSIFPNPNLQPEQGWNLELGYLTAWKLGKIKGVLDVAVFRMEYDNMMEFIFAQWMETPVLFDGVGFKSVNVGPTRIDGIEVGGSASRKFKESTIKISVGALLLDPVSLKPNETFSTTDLDVPLTFANTSTDPNTLKYRYRRQLNYSVNLTRKKWSIELSGVVFSKMDNIDLAFTQAISLFVPGIDTAYRNLTQYHLMNLIVRYEFNDTWTVGLNAQNLLNREYMLRPADLGAPRSVRAQLIFRL